MRGCFVTGTGTGVGKTVVAAAIVASLKRRGLRVAAHKPVLTGTDEPHHRGWPPDHELLAAAAQSTPDSVAPLRFGAAVAPHLAAELAGTSIELGSLVSAANSAAESADMLVVEGIGGLLVPLSDEHSVRDLAQALGLPLVVAASLQIGTINHTLLTIEAARAASLHVAGVVLTPWPATPSAVAASNRQTIARLAKIPVSTLPALPRADPALLAEAGDMLPLDDWIS